MAKEFIRMQKLAGLITENQYKRKLNEEETPQLTVSDIEKLKQDPKIQAFGKKLAQNPEELEKAKRILSKAGIDVGINESLEDISQGELDNAVDFVSSLSEDQNYVDPEELAVNLTFLGGGGGLIASFIPGVLPYVNTLLGFAVANPIGMVSLVSAGAVAPILAIGVLVAGAAVAEAITRQ